MQPIGFETMGSWGAGAKAFLTEVSSRVKQVTGNARAMEFLRQRIGIEIQRWNAEAVMGTVDSTKEWSNLFYSFELFVVVLFIYLSPLWSVLVR